MCGSMFITSWENSNIISTCLHQPSPLQVPVQAKVSREVINGRKIATKRAKCIEISLHPGTTTWETQTLLSVKPELSKNSTKPMSIQHRQKTGASIRIEVTPQLGIYPILFQNGLASASIVPKCDAKGIHILDHLGLWSQHLDLSQYR
jgi:hypothetical protein